jgi:hypothetical protein
MSYNTKRVALEGQKDSQRRSYTCHLLFSAQLLFSLPVKYVALLTGIFVLFSSFLRKAALFYTVKVCRNL